MRPKVRHIAQINAGVNENNKKLEKENKELICIQNEIKNSLTILETENRYLLNQKETLNQEIHSYSELLLKEKDKLTEYKNSIQEQLDLSAEKMSNEYNEAISKYQTEYEETLRDCVAEYQQQIESKSAELKIIEARLEDVRRKAAAAVDAYKREQEKKEQRNFYRINLSEEDVEEIHKLREVAKFLRDSEPLNKVIWKVYYENAFTDLCGRVVGKEQRSVIYKITNIQNNMCYIGQAKDVASRWLQHCKRGVGADTPTKNKLYPAMLEHGVENFTFEIVEDCELDKLNEREKYWQEFFKAKEFGYSIK